MKKLFFMALLAGLMILPGCNDDDSNSTSPVGPTGVSKGIVRVHFETEGIVGDIVSVKVFINDEQKAVLGKEQFDFVQKDIDPYGTTRVVVEPEFAEVEAPTENFDVFYEINGEVGISSDGGESWDIIKEIPNERVETKNRDYTTFADYVDRLKKKSCFQRSEYLIANGKVTLVE
ncbi:MAG: hypothetical protein MJ001_08140 [Paludibacteraceae bacterium]|nr:hypothetical protein [Paludibacteraceae bacterium]